LLAGSTVFAGLNTLWMRQAFLVLCSALFLSVLLPDATNAIVLVGFVLSGYLAACLLVRRRSTPLLAIYLTVLVAAFIVLKRYAFLQLLPGNTLLAHTLDIIGLSFILFRQIHYVVDVKQGEIPEFTLWSYLCYQLNPFTLLAGPIQRYQRFHEDWQTLSPQYADPHAIRMALLRILVGVIKVAFIADGCLWLVFSLPDSLWVKIAYFYLYPAYVYFNFAGYCDIVIAGASLTGVRVPENFERPYLARNMIDYWTRWHRTLSFWIRDYVFTPLYVAIARRRAELAPKLVFACYFVALFLAGVWHGATWNFVVFGLLNGVGVSAAKLWENWIVARHGRKGLRTYVASRPILVGARCATFHFVCLTMIFLRPDSTDRLIGWIGRLLNGAAGIAG
jgi:D-alanyl-lipoteichoic acid acyltransferase DltB (MBOAT superfamily)